MSLFEKIRKFESMHIVFWLIKDSCWMMEWKLIGVIMIIPTLFLALYLIIKTRNHRDVFLNTAIFFWISANSYWMSMEFYFNSAHKDLAGIPFVLGFVFILIFYLSKGKRKLIGEN